jgi:hypothetical protein
MRSFTRIIYMAAVVLCVSVASFHSMHAQSQPPAAKPGKGAPMTGHVTGPFDVKVTPQQGTSDPGISRLTIDKQFHGELDATSKGEMLANGGTQGTGGYVAMEVVTGKLGGRTGSFALQHSGTMIDNSFTLTIVVVPGSGTGQLAGLAGKMNILIAAGGKHSYDFEYTLPAE